MQPDDPTWSSLAFGSVSLEYLVGDALFSKRLCQCQTTQAGTGNENIYLEIMLIILIRMLMDKF